MIDTQDHEALDRLLPWSSTIPLHCQTFTIYILEARKKYEDKKISLLKFRRLRRAAELMEQCYKQGNIKWRRLPSWEKQFQIIGITDAYICDLKKMGRSGKTIKM